MGDRIKRSLKTASAITRLTLDYVIGNLMGGLTRALINTAVCLILMAISFLLGAWWF